jgi:sterol desaturase/sphingolipid hydroxylase (fatty acid hydroxylase superfamily)
MVNGLLSSFILYTLLGTSPIAATLAVGLTGIAELFYHWNIRTPYWLGFIVQRPESHRVHHQRGRHCNNYSDLPVWDMLFGTFENPRHTNFDCGFQPHQEQRLTDMLLGRDVLSN